MKGIVFFNVFFVGFGLVFFCLFFLFSLVKAGFSMHGNEKKNNLPSLVTISEMYNKVYWDKEMPETKKMLKLKFCALLVFASLVVWVCCCGGSDFFPLLVCFSLSFPTVLVFFRPLRVCQSYGHRFALMRKHGI